MMMTMIALCICHPAVAMGAGKNIVRPSFNLLTAKLQSLAHLSRARAVLEWDQLVTMPQAETTSASRGAQLAALASVIHEKSTAAELGDAITAAEREAAAAAAVASDDDDAAAAARDRAVIREARLEYDKEVNVPSELAERVALLGSEAYGAWAKARKLNDFNSFESTLARCFATAAELALARAGKTTASGEDGLAHSSTDSKTTTIPIISNEDDAYGLCLEEYEKGMGSARIDALFDEVEATLSPLIKRVLAAENQPSGHVLSPSSSSTLANSESSSPSSSSSSSSSSWPSSFPLDAQEKLNRAVVEAMGFDLSSGRVDVSVHPFTTSFGPKDVRITSRFNDQEWYQGLAGSMHECGHALYESQLRDTALPIDRPLSMGVHESQSLFWERHVGLSRPFWSWCGPLVREHLRFPSSSSPSSSSSSSSLGCSDDALYGAVNRVSKGLIRVEADELTYPMHVILRYRLERAILAGQLSTCDLPTAWTRGLKTLLGDDCNGINDNDDARGCLQDVHWSSLAVGYFPTYLLGAMMAAQLDHFLRHDKAFAEAHRDALLLLNGDYDDDDNEDESSVVDALVRRGNFAPLNAWMKDKVHDKGSVPRSMDDLLIESCGEPLNSKYFLDYLTKKYSALYRLRD